MDGHDVPAAAKVSMRTRGFPCTTTTQLVSFLLYWFRSFALFLGISDVLSSLSPRLLHLPLLCVVVAAVVRGSTLSVINTLV